MKLIRTIVKHSRKCFMKDNASPWSGIIAGQYKGNHAANPDSRLPGCHHTWYKVSCNDPDCNAICVIHSKVIKDMAAMTLEVDKLDYSKNQMYQ